MLTFGRSVLIVAGTLSFVVGFLGSQNHQSVASVDAPHVDDRLNVVLGLARYYPPWGLTFRIFVGSLRGSGYRGRIVLWVDPRMLENSGETVDWLRHQSVELVPIVARNCSFAFKVEDSGMDIRKLCAEGYETMVLEWARFALARDFVRSKCGGKGCGKVLLTDVRDTYFQ
eukprot:Hpha_TRINITY_DN26239_c0_g1::TRINITY_DN26239_c0_g1_i1::g.184696::m.184696